MAQLTVEQVEKVERLCGFSIFSSVVRNQLTTDYTQTVVDRVLEIFTELDNIDALLRDAQSTSFVVESRGAKLSYLSHVKHLKLEGSNLLKELAYILNIEVIYNKYSPKKSTVSYW